MKADTPKELLFERNDFFPDSPLFKKQSELVDLYYLLKDETVADGSEINKKSSGYSKTKVIISRLLDGKKKKNKKEIELVSQCIKQSKQWQNLNGTEDKFFEVFYKTFEFLYGSDVYVQSKEITDVTRELTNRAKSPSVQFVFSNEPAELRSDASANRLRQILVDNLRLTKPLDDFKLDKIKNKYHFFMSSEESAKEMWKKLFAYCLNHEGQELDLFDLLDRFTTLNKKKYLTISIINSICTINPYVIFGEFNSSSSYEFSADLMSGYVFHYLEENHHSIAKMSASSISDWKNEYVIDPKMVDLNALIDKDIKFKN